MFGSDRGPAPERTIALERVGRPGRGSLLLGRVDSARVLDELLRAAEDVVRRVSPVREHPVLALSRPDGGPAADGEHPSFELLRGWSGTRVVAAGASRVLRNGWPLRAGEPVVLLDGDRLESPDGVFRAAAGGPAPRRLLELGGRAAAPPPEGAELHEFEVGPAGGRAVLALGRATARALLDCVLGGDGGRAYETTALAEVDRAVVGWVVRRAANDACRVLFGTALGLTAGPGIADEPVHWRAAALRVGAHCGAVYLGLGESAVAAAAPHLPRRGPPPSAAAAGAIPVRVAVAIDAGAAAAEELAALAPGDTVIVRGGGAWFDGGPRGRAALAPGGARAPGLAVDLECAGATLRARVVGPRQTTDGGGHDGGHGG